MGMPDVKPFPVSPTQAITDIIESVAQEEAALAHIINAEGEKIQSVLGTLDPTTTQPGGGGSHPPIADLIRIDETVNDVLKTALKTQMLLQFKLEEAAKLADKLLNTP